MGGYGYRFQSYTATGSKTSEILGPVKLLPNSDVSLEDYFNYGNCAPRKTLFPVATRPYYDDDYKHGSPTMANPAGYDEEWHGQTSPVRGTMIPVSTRPHSGHNYSKSTMSKPYHAGDDDERYPPHRDDELFIKIAGVPIPVASRPLGADEYGHGPPKKANPARDDGKPREVPTKRTVVPIGTRPNGREYERSFPPEGTDAVRYDPAIKWHSPKKAQASQPVIWTEWRRPQRSDAYNGNEEEPKAVDSTNKSGKPIIVQDWSSSPRKGTKLREAKDDHDIDKIAEKFIQNTRFARASEGELQAPKPSAKNPLPNSNNDSRDRRSLGVDRPTPTSPSNHGPGSPVDARRRSATIDCWEAERKYKGQRV